MLILRQSTYIVEHNMYQINIYKATRIFVNSHISPKTVIVIINYMLVQNLFKFKCYDKIAAPNKNNENTHLQ